MSLHPIMINMLFFHADVQNQVFVMSHRVVFSISFYCCQLVELSGYRQYRGQSQ